MRPPVTVSRPYDACTSNPPNGGENFPRTGRVVTRRDVTPRPAAPCPSTVGAAPNIGAMPTRPVPSHAPVEQLLTVAEVAATLRLDPYTIRRWIGRGHLPAVRVGRELRIEQAELRRYIDSQVIR